MKSRLIQIFMIPQLNQLYHIIIHRLKGILLLFIFAIASVFTLNYCSKNDNSEELYYRFKVNSADSIWNYYSENRQSLDAWYLSSLTSRLYFNHPKEYEKLHNYRTQYLKEHPNDSLNAFYVLDTTYTYLWNFDEKLTPIAVSNLKKFKGPEDNFYYQMTLFNIYGSYHFYVGELDSSDKYFNMGFERASKVKLANYIYDYSLNLGALATSRGFYGVAADYFLIALKNSETRDNAMLYNNIATSYLQDGKVEKAYYYINKNRTLLDPTNHTYEGQIAKLTYIGYLLEVQKPREADKLLSVLSENEIQPIYQGELFHKRFVCQMLKEKYKINTVNMEQFLAEHANKFVTYYSTILTNSSISILDYIEKNYSIFSKLINEAEANIHFNELLPIAKYNYFELRQFGYKSQGDFAQAYSYSDQSKVHLSEHYALTDSIRVADLQQKFTVSEFNEKLEASQAELDRKKQELSLTVVVIILMTVMLVALVFQGKKLNANKTRLIEQQRLLLESRQRDLDHLETEKELQAKIMSISEIIVSNGRAILQIIRNSTNSNLPEMIEIRQTLEQISLIDSAVDTHVPPPIKEYRVDEILSELGIKEELTDSQMRILALTLENYKAKEIAVLMNLSYAYVRNVQSKLRKIFKDHGVEDFKDLKL